MKVLVTGATSLLGRTVALVLAERGDQVTCFQRRSSGLGLAEVQGDVRDAGTVQRAGRDQDAVIHLAALVAPRMDWDEAVAVNVDGTANVQRAAASCGAFVHVSTPSVAFHEAPAASVGAETASYAGTDRYARSKAIAERAVLEAAARGSVPTVVVRPHLVWGPGDEQLVGRIVERARAGRLVVPDGGRALVDSTYLDDAARAIVAALDAARPGSPAIGRPWVVTGGDPRPVAELVGGIVAAAGLPVRLRSVPAPVASVAGRLAERWWAGPEPPLTRFAARQLSLAHWFDQRATREALGWQPEFGVDEGMERLRRWFAARP